MSNSNSDWLRNLTGRYGQKTGEGFCKDVCNALHELVGPIKEWSDNHKYDRSVLEAVTGTRNVIEESDTWMSRFLIRCGDSAPSSQVIDRVKELETLLHIFNATKQGFAEAQAVRDVNVWARVCSSTMEFPVNQDQSVLTRHLRDVDLPILVGLQALYRALPSDHEEKVSFAIIDGKQGSRSSEDLPKVPLHNWVAIDVLNELKQAGWRYDTPLPKAIEYEGMHLLHSPLHVNFGQRIVAIHENENVVMRDEYSYNLWRPIKNELGSYLDERNRMHQGPSIPLATRFLSSEIAVLLRSGISRALLLVIMEYLIVGKNAERFHRRLEKLEEVDSIRDGRSHWGGETDWKCRFTQIWSN